VGDFKENAPWQHRIWEAKAQIVGLQGSPEDFMIHLTAIINDLELLGDPSTSTQTHA
jgi:hypothetical protein